MYKITIKLKHVEAKGMEDTFIHVFQTEPEVNAYVLAMREVADFYLWEIHEQVGGYYEDDEPVRRSDKEKSLFGESWLRCYEPSADKPRLIN